MIGAMVIVGAGEAGGRAALALRERGFGGEIVLIGEEPHAPYERPPLSKSVMTHPDPTPKQIATDDQWRASSIRFMPGMTAAHIDRAASRVILSDGTAIDYARLLLATGARPRLLSVPGAERALYLRNFADALALRARLPDGAHVTVIGGGFIGLEVAASAVARGCRVTLLEVGPRILTRGVPEEIAAHVAARHRAAGVDVRVGVSIAGIAEGRVSFANGSEIVCDCILAGIGALPETTLAAECGLEIENGVRVDAALRSSDPSIFAAGDCCSFPAPLYGGRRLRLEAWRNASEQGSVAAANMLGVEQAYDAVPWFWSDQYDEVLQVAGLVDEAVTTVRRDGAGMLFFHLDAAGRLVAASGVGLPSVAKDLRIAEMLIARRATPDPASLAAPSFRLKTLLGA